MNLHNPSTYFMSLLLTQDDTPKPPSFFSLNGGLQLGGGGARL